MVKTVDYAVPSNDGRRRQ